MNMIHQIVEPYRMNTRYFEPDTLKERISMFRLDPEVTECLARCKNPRRRRARLKCWIVEFEDKSEKNLGRPYTLCRKLKVIQTRTILWLKLMFRSCTGLRL
jgi:hypothetical protein